MPDQETILRPFTSFENTGMGYAQILSQLHTSRLAAYGYTAEAEVLGITRYQISAQLDVRTCPVCRVLHGRSFPVTEARNLLNEVLFEKDPEKIKELHPWPKQNKANVERIKEMPEDELIGRRWFVPPFHVLCRCLLVAAGDAPALFPETEVPDTRIPTPMPDKKPEEIQETFEELGKTITRTQAETWRDKIKYEIVPFFAGLLGVPVISFLRSVFATDIPSLDRAGLKKAIWDKEVAVFSGALFDNKPIQWRIGVDLEEKLWELSLMGPAEQEMRERMIAEWTELFSQNDWVMVD